MSAPRPWSGRSHDELAELVRELLLAGHLIDRAGMPAVISHLGPESMGDVAIGEWMAASPIYTKRMQRLLDFEGDTVDVIFKGIQFDVGAPLEFLDFRMQVDDDHHGRFHLDHCGALMDVEPMGDEYVRTMCHDIEDPTFDATAIATNPRARIRPVHRPPRVPADRTPHCEWTVTIDDAHEPLPIPERSADLQTTSRVAQIPLAEPDPSLSADDGATDYADRFDPDLALERFSSSTLAAIADEIALQAHLLTRAFLVEVADRSPDRVEVVGAQQAAGINGLTTKRLAAALGAPATVDGLARVLRVHPLFLPRSYVSVDLAATHDALTVSLHPCAGLDEDDGLSWPGLLAGPHGDDILWATVMCLVPTAQLARIESTGDAVVAWSVTDDPDAGPADQPDAVTLTEFSTGASFEFQRGGGGQPVDVSVAPS
ncbi:MAG: hypothetical protein U5K30_17475 [Acidimicrobiales bacterium]|nr:hypothetical protein [Acidimicrobiales bacterium]